MAERDRVKAYMDRLAALEQERHNWEDQWRDVVEYILARRGYFEQGRGDRPNRGDARHASIVDGTAARAVRVLAAGMQGGLTSPARPWFRLQMADEGLHDDWRVRGWLQEVESLLDRGVDPQSKPLQSIGYKQILMVIRDGLDLEEAVRLIVRETKKLAKRQMTWFRGDAEITWLPADDRQAFIQRAQQWSEGDGAAV